MSTDMLHPTPDRLEAYADGSLADADHAVLESHLLSCARCQVEVEEWRSLFTALASLPALEPAAGFADRVMAGVLIARPLSVRIAEMLRRLVPTTTTGWALVAALLAIPVVTAGGAAAWLVAQPWFRPDSMWLFARERGTEALLSLGGRAGASVMESQSALWLVEQTGALLEQYGPREAGAVAVVFALLTVVSIYVLYSNLFRTRTQDDHYATL